MNIIAATFAVIRLLLILIPRSNIYPMPAISLLIFMQGELGKNAFLLLRTFAVMSSATPAAEEENPLKRMINNIKNEISRYRSTVSDVIPLLYGAGIILILFNLYAGSLPRKNIAALAAIVFLLRCLSRSGWFYTRLNSLIGKIKSFTKGKVDVKKISAGMSAGLILSIPVSLIPYVYIGTITGGMLIITAIIISVKVT